MNSFRESDKRTSVCLSCCNNGGRLQYASVRGITYVEKDLGSKICQAMHVV